MVIYIFNYYIKERGNQSTLKYYFIIILNATNNYFTIVFDGIQTLHLEVTRLNFYH
jgi:hypothetical protein